MKQQNFDLIVLGGGLVGLTMANLCANQGFSVVVIEAQKPILQWSDENFDIRCSAISRGSQKIFQKLGIWNALVSTRVSPYRHMVVWDALGFGEISFDAAEVAESDLGHIIENRVIIKALWEKAETNSNITLMTPARPMALKQEGSEYILLELAGSQFIQGKLMIGADGGRSWVREAAKIDTAERDYQQAALVVTVKTESPHQETAWQRLLPEGPLAFLPLLEPYTSSIVWTAAEEKIKVLMALEEKLFCKELAHSFDYRLGKVLSASNRQTFSLKMLHAKQYIMERIALMGDAAHVIHPLAGQGVNLGLQDVECLVEIITNAKKNDYDIGNRLVLRKYERARQGQIQAMITAMDFFKYTFSLKSSVACGLRSMGLNGVNSSKFLKKKIILKAMGI